MKVSYTATYKEDTALFFLQAPFFNGALTKRKEHKKAMPPVMPWDIFL